VHYTRVWCSTYINPQSGPKRGTSARKNCGMLLRSSAIFHGDLSRASPKFHGVPRSSVPFSVARAMHGVA
jgi:hypothetical protein